MNTNLFCKILIDDKQAAGTLYDIIGILEDIEYYSGVLNRYENTSVPVDNIIYYDLLLDTVKDNPLILSSMMKRTSEVLDAHCRNSKVRFIKFKDKDDCPENYHNMFLWDEHHKLIGSLGSDGNVINGEIWAIVESVNTNQSTLKDTEAYKSTLKQYELEKLKLKDIVDDSNWFS